MMHEKTFFILAALAHGPLHGYGVIARARELSGDRVRIGAGTLYSNLDRLSRQELVVLDREEIVNSRLRRYYRLTATGQAALDQEAARMRKATDAVPARPATGKGRS